MQDFLHAFREAAPYIHYLRGKTVVVGITARLLDRHTLGQLAADFNLLAALGVRLVLVHGTRAQIQQFCESQQHPLHHHHDYRITDERILQYAKQICGEHQFNIQAALSLGVAHTVQHNKRLRIATGNYVVAKPLGVLDGVDMRYTGQVRKIDHHAINRALDDGEIVVISPLGTSPAGQSYSLSMSEVAAEAAIALHAEKLIFLIEQDGIITTDGSLKHSLSANQANELIGKGLIVSTQHHLLETALTAVEKGISRVQILSGRRDGDLLRELYTRHGVGTSIAQAEFTNIRPATERDIADIIALIRPLEAKGILIPRSRAYLEEHINEFAVLENDRQIYGCVALKQFASQPQAGELGCLVVSPHARDEGYGEKLLEYVVQQAQQQGKTQLFSLSTHAADWFLERGFQAALLQDLPAERQQEYQDNGRQSKIFLLNVKQYD